MTAPPGVFCFITFWYKLIQTLGVGGLKVISAIHVAIVFLGTIHHKNEETAKKI